MKEPRFLISIIGLNKLDSTKACIESVLKNSGDRSRYWLQLTNNGSEDGTGEYFNSLAMGREDVIVIQNATNEGFIGPNNDAFERARFVGFEYFICLNNDTEVPPGWLDLLVAPLDLDPTGVLSGPGMFGLKDDMHGTDQNGLKEYLEGSCLCAKVSIVSQYGPLFADYLTFIYGDDSDLSLRMREKGHAIYQVPFTMKHPRCTTVKQNAEVKARCDAAQEKNHGVLKHRWAHYLKTRIMGYPIVLKRHIACGDTLLLTPIIRALKKSNPLSPIYVETKSPSVLLGNPNLAGFIAPGGAYLAGSLAIDLEMAYEDRTHVHIIDAYADAVRTVVPGLGPVDHKIEMFPGLQEMYWAIQLRANNRFSDNLCVMHIDHGGWPGKNWPKDRFNEVALYLVKKGWHVAVVGSQPMPDDFNAFNLTGMTSTMQLAALLRGAQLFVGLDSFCMHAAVANGCPTVGIFGVTSSKYIMADGADSACVNGDPTIPGTGARHRIAGSRCVDSGPDCINSITVDQVLSKIEELI